MENGNGTHHITQSIWTDARLDQFTASEVDNLSKLTLYMEILGRIKFGGWVLNYFYKSNGGFGGLVQVYICKSIWWLGRWIAKVSGYTVSTKMTEATSIKTDKTDNMYFQ